MPADWNPRPEIRRLAREAGVDLPDTTIEELATHLDDVYESALEDGATVDDALAQAQAALTESAFDVLRRHASRHPVRPVPFAPPVSAPWSLPIMHALIAAGRHLRHAKGFAATTILVLGLGVGAATTVFTIVDTVVLRPLPFHAPDALVTLWDTNSEKGVAHEPISPVNFMDYRALPVFDDAAAWWRPGINLLDPGQDPVRVNTIEASANLFRVLGVAPQLGEGFPAGDRLFDRDVIAVISDRLWHTRYSADPSIVGRSISLNGRPYRVAGVMPPGFHFPDDVDVWQRLQWDLTQHSREAHFMEAVLRVKPGTSLGQAQSAVDTLAKQLQREYPASNGAWGARLVPLLDEQLGFYRPALLVLFGAVALLLAIAVANVASLLLARAVARGREMAVRVALGAATRHLLAQLLAESALLSMAGAVVGLATTAVTLPLLVRTLPVTVPRLDAAAVDGRTLLVCLGVVVGATFVFGVVPAWLVLRQKVGAELKAGERGSSKPARRLYSVLVGAEVAMACALLVGSGLLVRTVQSMVRVPVGVAADDVVITPIQVRPSGARGREGRAAWLRVAELQSQLLDEVRQQPGVTSAGSSNFLPLTTAWHNPFAIEGEPRAARDEDLPQAQMQSVSDAYLDAMGVPVRDGRTFTAFDHAESAPVAVVNEAFVSRYLPQGPAVGRVLRMWSTGIGPLGANVMATGPLTPDGLPFEIVGVVGNVLNGALGQPVEPAIYFSSRQFPFSEVFVAIKASDKAAAVSALRAALRRVTPDVPMGIAQTWRERFDARTAEARVLMAVLLVFAGVAACLAAVGVYGLFSWSVALRRRELAIRLTLGAQPRSVGAVVLGQGAVLVAVGLAVGVLVVRLADAALARVVFGVTSGDVTSLVGACAVMLLAALAACVPPALRAASVDPVEGLRVE